ncbi:MAG: peptide ABC transporter permease [Alteromonadaceae bacterium]|nr:peptide ABC transporter permease [Alteromonadaceae bacterium]
MMAATLFRLTVASVWHRRGTLSLVVLTLTLSVSLLLGVQYVRSEVKQSFVNTVSGTDLIVGARSGPLNLLLYSVFHIGNPTNNISWPTYQAIVSDPAVEWTVPLSLGDSHRGYRVIGTTTDFFQYFQHGRSQMLAFDQGEPFSDLFEAVIGASVADALGYAYGQEIVLAHGTGSVSFVKHDDKPFEVVGVLAPTGTPVDNAVLVSLEAIEAIHLGWQGGVPAPGRRVTAAQAREQNLEPKAITAALVGVERKVATFQLQRKWNQWSPEPLSAILPGVALSELWRLLSGFEAALLAITAFVVVISLVGMVAVLLTAQAQRSREMAILRACGASPLLLALLFSCEALLIALCSIALALVVGFSGLAFVMPVLGDTLGLHLELRPLAPTELYLLALVPLAALVVSWIPAWRAYRKSLAEGLTPRE